LHLAALVRAKKAEADLIKTWEGLPCTQFELTHTSSVVARVAQFLSSEKQRTKALAGHLKRKRESLSDSSDDETGSSGKKVAEVKEGTRAAALMQEIVEKLSGASKGKAIGHFSNCPYPSAAEEKFRVKRQRKLEAELERESPEACHLTSKEVAEFIMVLKDMCRDRTVVQVLHHHSFTLSSHKYGECSVLLKTFFNLSIKHTLIDFDPNMERVLFFVAGDKGAGAVAGQQTCKCPQVHE
jgi:hypothetical protein